MRWEQTKTATRALGTGLAVGALILLALSGCGGGGKSASAELNAHYLRVANVTRELTSEIERAIHRPPGGSRQIERTFRSLAGRVEYRATFLQTISALGPVGVKAFVLQHSLLIYEATLHEVAKHARQGDRSLTPFFRGVHEAGVEVRANDAAWERALKAKAADL